MVQNMTYGLISLPDIEDDIIDVSLRDQSDSCRGYDKGFGVVPIDPDCLVLHKQQSQVNSTLGHPTGYFTAHCCPALTDMEINAVTGRMRRFRKRGGDIIPWANGRVSAPYGDALAYLNWFKLPNGGWDFTRVNKNPEALEISGWFPAFPVVEDTTVTLIVKQKIARWMAARAHNYGIKWQDFPLVIKEGGRSFLTWHREWTIGTGKTCPGPYIMSITSELIEMARAIMKAYQGEDTVIVDPVPPAYEPVNLPDWWSAQLELSHPNDEQHLGVTWYVLQRNVKALARTIRRPEPGSDKESGPEVTAGTKLHIERTATANGKVWLMEEAGHYLLASKFTPQFGAFKPRTLA